MMFFLKNLKFIIKSSHFRKLIRRNLTDMVTRIDENIHSLFPYVQYTNKYILLTNRGLMKADANNLTSFSA